MLVFKTIVENVRSFFHKEDELEQPPKKAPDAAVEIFEKPERHVVVQHTLQGPLTSVSQSTAPAGGPTGGPKLPFSSEQLRQRMMLGSSSFASPTSSAPSSTQSPSSSPQLSTSSFSTSSRNVPERDISVQIEEFEQAIRSIPGEDGSRVPLSAAKQTTVREEPRASGTSSIPTFFSDFSKMLREQGYADASLSADELLARMKRHHELRLAHEKYQGMARDLEEGLTYKLAELQELERDWARKQEEILVARDRSLLLENEIVQKGAELKMLVAAFREHASKMPPQQPPVPSSPPLSSPSLAVQSPVPISPQQQTPQIRPTAPSLALPGDSSFNQSAQSPEIPPSEALPSSASLHSPVVPIPSGTSIASSNAPLEPHQRFFLADGRTLSSLADLRTALLAMDDGLYYRHVLPERNDFADWIVGIFHDELLAEKARHCRTRYELAALLPL